MILSTGSLAAAACSLEASFSAGKASTVMPQTSSISIPCPPKFFSSSSTSDVLPGSVLPSSAIKSSANTSSSKISVNICTSSGEDASSVEGSSSSQASSSAASTPALPLDRSSPRSEKPSIDSSVSAIGSDSSVSVKNSSDSKSSKASGSNGGCCKVKSSSSALTSSARTGIISVNSWSRRFCSA